MCLRDCKLYERLIGLLFIVALLLVVFSCVWFCFTRVTPEEITNRIQPPDTTTNNNAKMNYRQMRKNVIYLFYRIKFQIVY